MGSVDLLQPESGTGSGARRWHPDTIAVRAGRGSRGAGEPLNQPPVFASAFHSGGDHAYAREGNPTWEAFEAAIGELEGGHAVAFASGMAAAAATLELLPPTARVLAARSSYHEVRKLLDQRHAAGNMRVSLVDAIDPVSVRAALPASDVLWLDALSNPSLDVAEIDVFAAAAHEAGAIIVVDSTLVTPMLQRPIEHGADFVLHSATKQIGGHSDLLLGVVVAREASGAERLRDARTMLGAVPGTMEAWLGLRGLRTLALRLERGQANATAIAEWLVAQPSVTRVRYPGLAGDPSQATASRLLDGPGTMLAFEVEGGAATGDAICEQVELITHAGSLGGVESLIQRHGRWQADADVPPGLLRFSAGCEDVSDLRVDLARAFELSSSAVSGA